MNQIFISCPKNSENMLANEIEKITGKKIKISNGGVFLLNGNQHDIYGIALKSALAIRVLLQIQEFTFENEKDIYNNLKRIHWADIFSEKQTILIQTNFRSTELKNSNYISQLTKDAICDYFREKTGSRPDVAKRDPEISINIYIHKNHCSVNLDCIGKSLNKRGYRKKDVHATLKETLGASLLTLARWDKSIPLYDLMCGSGTIPIEAALKRADIAPGLIQPVFSFQNWKNYSINQFTDVYNKYKKKVKIPENKTIYANDIDPNSIIASKINASAAGIDSIIHFSTIDFFDFIPKEKGFLILNPPYGIRIGAPEDQKKLFQEIGKKIKNDFKDFTAGIISPDLDDLKILKMTPERKYKLFNGNILCYFNIYKIF